MEKYDIDKCCAVSGHRTLYRGFDKRKLSSLFEKIIKEGYEYFFIGMAVGFDTACFQTLEKLREKYPIKLIACVPCENQESKFSEKDKIEYDRMLCSANKGYLISKTYSPYCMQKRNMFMVDNSSLIVVYLKKESGGTKNTYDYAMKKKKKIVFFE